MAVTSDVPAPVHPVTTLSPRIVEDLSTSALVTQLFSHVTELVKEQVSLARVELEVDLRRAIRAIVVVGAAAAVGIIALALLFVAVAQTIAFTMPPPVASLIVGVVLLVVAVIAGLIGYRRLPKQPMARTREELREEIAWTKKQLG